ncbi:hypothetical protein [Dermacoccus sp. Tok2021]|uniref:hypothetical protein n=1 Tax=Dermacoccus sp. Tok2021 TaxID=2826873 RepID=UPI001CA74804|nr:hypothetical protein [Dermacoccus sp. Tok2021]MBZ4498038.1 hypothetical protein [Dermacoccus sp. Tok2021]
MTDDQMTEAAERDIERVADATPETAPEGVTTTDALEDERAEGEGSDDPSGDETFPREYVEKLRKENADARVKAKRADDLAARLHTALVAATGRLADPSDLPFDDAHLEDEDALNAAVDALLARKPHLASRRPVGSIGQGATAPADSVSLAGILRQNAR